METIRNLGLPQLDVEEQFRRAVFNVMIRNQDDHVKNIAFLMNRRGEWRLSPAYDVGYAYNPSGDWTSRHQMSLNGKRDEFTLDDLLTFAAFCGLKPRKAKTLIAEMSEKVLAWPDYAQEAGVIDLQIDQINMALRVSFS